MNGYPWVVTQFDRVVEDFVIVAVFPSDQEEMARDLASRTKPLLANANVYVVQRSWRDVALWMLNLQTGISLTVKPESEAVPGTSDDADGAKTLYHHDLPIAVHKKSETA